MSIIIEGPHYSQPEESDYLDKDIAEDTKDSSLIVGTASLFQLNRNMSKMIEVLSRLEAAIAEQNKRNKIL